MFNVGAGEMLVILLLALIVLGPDKLPSAARQAGKYLADFRRMSDGFQRELRDAMDIDGMKPQSGTMAPAKKADVAKPATDDTGTDTGTDASTVESGSEPVSESDRVIESTNGPTLPPVMHPTTIPDATTPTTTPAVTAGDEADVPVADETGPASPAVEVDGPSASFD